MERPFNFHRQVILPFESALHILEDEPGILLGMARDAAIDLAMSDEHFPHVMTPAPTPNIEHDIEIVIGQARRVDHRAVMVPVIFSHVDGAPWFPEVDGEIEVTDLNDSTPWCDVSFFGTYRPRWGVLGAAMDVAGTHLAVEATLERFFLSACAHLLDTAKAEGAMG